MGAIPIGDSPNVLGTQLKDKNFLIAWHISSIVEQSVVTRSTKGQNLHMPKIIFKVEKLCLYRVIQPMVGCLSWT